MKKKLTPGVTPGPYIETVLLDRGRIADPTHYAFQLPAIRNFSRLDLHPKVTFFVGENGSGKSTLLEAIAIANGLNADRTECPPSSVNTGATCWLSDTKIPSICPIDTSSSKIDGPRFQKSTASDIIA